MKFGETMCFIVVPLGTIIIPLIARTAMIANTRSTTTFTIEKLERVTDRDGEGSRYMVFTPNEVFENTDELWLGKFNSSDLYGALKIGCTYEANVVGQRNAFLNWHRNIVSATPKSCRPNTMK
jgi:hypothetical protein